MKGRVIKLKAEEEAGTLFVVSYIDILKGVHEGDIFACLVLVFFSRPGSLAVRALHECARTYSLTRGHTKASTAFIALANNRQHVTRIEYKPFFSGH